MLWMVVSAALAAGSGPALEAQSAQQSDPVWEVWAGMAGGIRLETSGGGGTGLAGINRKIGKHFRPELVLGLGGYGGPGDVMSRFRIGTRYEWVLGRWAPYLWAAFAHNHEATFASAAANPVPITLGLSEQGVNHRSGVEFGGGLDYQVPTVLAAGRVAGRLGLRVTGTELLGDGPATLIETSLILGACF